MRITRFLLPAVLPLALAACVSLPEGPGVMVLPGTGTSFEQFRQDDQQCRQYAAAQIGQSAEGAATQSTLGSAAVGTVVGAVAGAAIGGRRGAGVGAGAGLIVGSASGVGTAQVSTHEAQRRYDNAFVQCMYAKGHRVPVSGHYSPDRVPAAPAGATPPPPPPPPPASR
ncbi:MAG: hypothetical protein HS110_06970 [Zoogloeaceae bacterium]|nr:hypothetical protein [Zoogloeaceae bacterium]MCK6383495.1 hypothetical protein [Rhodocyclaceae bacterium]